LLAEADKMMQADGLRPQDLDGFQKAQYWQELAVGYIKNDPGAFVRSYLLGVFHTLFSLDTKAYSRILGLPADDFDIKGYTSILDATKAFLGKKGIVGLLIGGTIASYLLVTYLGAMIGLLASWKRYADRPSLVLILLFALYFVLITGVAGLARFKLPAIPFYLAFAGMGLSYLYESAILARKAKKR